MICVSQALPDNTGLFTIMGRITPRVSRVYLLVTLCHPGCGKPVAVSPAAAGRGYPLLRAGLNSAMVTVLDGIEPPTAQSRGSGGD